MNFNYCQQCGEKIEMMIYKHTGVCSIICQKRFKGEITEVPRYVIRQELP